MKRIYLFLIIFILSFILSRANTVFSSDAKEAGYIITKEITQNPDNTRVDLAFSEETALKEKVVLAQGDTEDDEEEAEDIEEEPEKETESAEKDAEYADEEPENETDESEEETGYVDEEKEESAALEEEEETAP